MVCLIIIVVWICGQEVERTLFQELVNLRIGTEHFGSVAHILVCIHHLWQAWHQVDTHTDVGIDTCSDGSAAAGLQYDDTIGALGTIDGSTILQYGNLLDVGRIDVQQLVVEHTCLK